MQTQQAWWKRGMGWSTVALVVLCVLVVGGMPRPDVIARSPATEAPGERSVLATVPAMRPLPTEVPIDRPGVIPTLDSDSARPTRPAAPTPTSHPARMTPTPTVPVPGVPTQAPVSTADPTAMVPNPQPNQPTPVPDTQPTPTPVPPFVPGRNNVVEITVYQCRPEVDRESGEAALLAACPQVEHTEEMFMAFGQLAEDVSGVYTWGGLDYVPGDLIFEEVEYPAPGIDIPYPAGPVVFCGEGEAPNQQVPVVGVAGIRPGLTALSDVNYSCNWFKIAVGTTTVRVLTFSCDDVPPTDATESWHAESCTQSPGHLYPRLTDEHGTRTGALSDDAFSWFWADASFGLSDHVTVKLDFSQSWSDDMANVFCDTNSEQTPTVEDPVMTISVQPGDPVREYRCRVYAFSSVSGWGESWNDALNASNSAHVSTWYCPADMDFQAVHEVFVNTCVEPAPGVDVAVKYPAGGPLAIQRTSQTNPAVAVFGLMGLGHFSIAAAELPGYESVAWCRYEFGLSNFRLPAAAWIGQVPSWDRQMVCYWYYIPEA